MSRRTEQRLRVGDLHDTPEIHHADAVRHVPHDGQIVADEQIGQTQPVLEILHQVQNLRLHGDIERRSRFVTDDELGVRGQRTCNRNALPHAPRELVRIMAAVDRIEANEHQELADLVRDIGVRCGEPKSTDWFGDDIERAPARIQTGVGILKNHLDAPTQLAPFGCMLRVMHRNAVDRHLTRRGRHQTDHHARDRRLAGAGFADQGERLAGIDGKTDIGDGSQKLPRQAFERPIEPGPRDVEDTTEILGHDEMRGHSAASAGASRYSQQATFERASGLGSGGKFGHGAKARGQRG